MVMYPSVGECFGRYRISALLGQGGMGVVFSAVHEGLNRRVALKVLSPDLALQPAFRHRFSREAAALASLYSPHIIDIYDHGEIDGCLFMATQLVTGGDLGAWLERDGALTPSRALAVVSQVTSAVVDAHDAGVMHRDIKPSNVLLRRSAGTEVFAYLGDFGIAQSMAEDRTRSSGVVGTLAYMAPERHEGADAAVSSDIYSLGCLLWATLFGRAPYQGHDVQVAIQHLEAPVPTYPGTDAFSRSVNVVLHQAMAKHPDDRYATAGAMLTDLTRAAALAEDASVRPAPVLPGPGSRPGRTSDLREGGDAGPAPVSRTSRRPRRTWWAGAAALILVLAGTLIGVGLWSSDSVRCDDGTTAADEEACAQQGQTAGAGDPPRVTCWNGARVDRRGACLPPRGLEGLTWTFPSMQRDLDDCHRRFDATRDASRQSWFCLVKGGAPGEGISYTEWTAPEAARHVYDRQYPSAPVNFLVGGRPVGFRWIETTPRPNGFAKVSMAYLNLPFSTSVYARSRDGLERVCSSLMVRSPQTFEAQPTGCLEDTDR
jgi:serine/threonine-protein kinase